MVSLGELDPTERGFGVEMPEGRAARGGAHGMVGPGSGLIRAARRWPGTPRSER
jgi:hypothetical protein